MTMCFNPGEIINCIRDTAVFYYVVINQFIQEVLSLSFWNNCNLGPAELVLTLVIFVVISYLRKSQFTDNNITSNHGKTGVNVVALVNRF